jgi:hypothetical protein
VKQWRVKLFTWEDQRTKKLCFDGGATAGAQVRLKVIALPKLNADREYVTLLKLDVKFLEL